MNETNERGWRTWWNSWRDSTRIWSRLQKSTKLLCPQGVSNSIILNVFSLQNNVSRYYHQKRRNINWRNSCYAIKNPLLFEYQEKFVIHCWSRNQKDRKWWEVVSSVSVKLLSPWGEMYNDYGNKKRVLYSFIPL